MYHSHKDVNITEQKLNGDLSHLSKWFELDELIINLKKGKTECMLFGSWKWLSKFKEYQLNTKYNETLVNYTRSNLSEHFNRLYKKASGLRLRLLLRIRQSITTRTAATVYEMMIVPIVTYFSLVNPSSCPSRENKLDRFENKVRNIV